MDARHEQELNTLMQKHAQEVTALLKRQAEERNRYAERFTEHVIAALVDGMKDYGRSAEAVRDSMERKVEEAQRMDEDGAVEPSVDEIAHRAEPKLLTEEEDDELQHQSYLSDLRKVEALEREERRAQEQPQKVDVEPSDDAWKRHTQEQADRTDRVRRFNARAIVLEQRQRQEDQEASRGAFACDLPRLLYGRQVTRPQYAAIERSKRHAAEWDALRKEFGLHN